MRYHEHEIIVSNKKLLVDGNWLYQNEVCTTTGIDEDVFNQFIRRLGGGVGDPVMFESDEQGTINVLCLLGYINSKEKVATKNLKKTA